MTADPPCPIALAMSVTEPSNAIPAATLVIFRNVDRGPPHILMVERAKSLAFAGGALVFPGGRVDPGDRIAAASLSGDADDNAARIAAIRETVEEVGLSIGLSARSRIIADDLRAEFAGGRTIGDVLGERDIELQLDALIPFARWLPDEQLVRTFDTRFYLAALPDDASDAVVDATENVRLFWGSAAHFLREAEEGRASVIFPTRRNLERIAQFNSFEEAVADSHAHPVRLVTPWSEDRAGVRHLCIPDDLGYPVTAEAFKTAMRQ